MTSNAKSLDGSSLTLNLARSLYRSPHCLSFFHTLFFPPTAYPRVLCTTVHVSGGFNIILLDTHVWRRRKYRERHKQRQHVRVCPSLRVFRSCIKHFANSPSIIILADQFYAFFLQIVSVCVCVCALLSLQLLSLQHVLHIHHRAGITLHYPTYWYCGSTLLI